MSYLKPVVVASTMLVASLSLPAFADHANYTSTTVTEHANYTSTVQPQGGVVVDYTKVIGRNSPTYNTMAPQASWEKRVFVGGLVNGDLTYAQRGFNSDTLGFRLPDFAEQSVHADTITLNNANLFIDTKINDFTTGHLGLVITQRPGESTVSSSALKVDEAYATFNNFCQSPFYLQAGRKFTSFGNYDPYPITYSLTQLLTQTDEEVIELGYVSTDGFHGALYAYNGPRSQKDNRINNFGADLGFNAQYDNVLYNVGIGYVKDIRDSQFINAQLDNKNAIPGVVYVPQTYPVGTYSNTLPDAFTRQTGGLALHADVSSGPFELRADYVQAMRQLIADYDIDNGTKAEAFGVRGAFGFDSAGYVSQFGVGYQGSQGSRFLGMPKDRVLADYSIEVNKNVKVTVEYAHNKNYSKGRINDGSSTTTASYATPNGGTSNVATVRVGVAL